MKGEKIVKDRRRGFFFSFKKFGIFQDTTEDDKSFEKRCLNESENTKDISDKKFDGIIEEGIIESRVKYHVSKRD